MIERILIIFLIASISISGFSQTDLSGKYWTISCGFTHGYFLRLLPDSVAHYTPIYEYADRYYQGTWHISHDTLIVKITDTSDFPNKHEYFLIKDSLTLEKINKAPYVLLNTLYRQEAYYPNGDIKYKIDYGFKDGQYCFDGRLYYYHSLKRLKKVIDYKDGQKHGIEINYTWYGYAESFGQWKKGEKHGVWRYYDADFNMVGYEKYKKGKLKYGNKKGFPCYPRYDLEILNKLYLNKK